jgi:hypothetical protein
VETTPDIPISNLRADPNGSVIASDDPGYDDARGVFFTGFDRRPAAIVRVADASDVPRGQPGAGDRRRACGAQRRPHRARHGTSEDGIALDLSERGGRAFRPYSWAIRAGSGLIRRAGLRAIHRRAARHPTARDARGAPAEATQTGDTERRHKRGWGALSTHLGR